MFFKNVLKYIIVFIVLVSCTSNDTPQTPEEKPVGEFLDDWTYKVNVASSSSIDVAEFRIWIPDGITNLRALLVLAPHYNGNGLYLSTSKEWQEFAKQEKLALCGVNLKGTSYTNPSSGSGKALLTAIEKIANRNNISKLIALPLLLRGYSAGGVYSYNFSSFKPNSVVGFVNIRGGSLAQSSSSNNNNVPGLTLAGALEGDERINYIKEIITEKRSQGGLWSFALEPNADHFSSLAASNALAKVFFKSLLKKRISNTNNQLNTLQEEEGWLGNPITKNVFPFNDYTEDKSIAFWLIDKNFANAWRNFQIK